MNLITKLSLIIASTIALNACEGKASNTDGSGEIEVDTNQVSVQTIDQNRFNVSAINANGEDFIATNLCVDSDLNFECDEADIVYQVADNKEFSNVQNIIGSMLILQNEKSKISAMLNAEEGNNISVTPLTTALAFYQFYCGENNESSIKTFAENAGIPRFVLLSADGSNTALVLLMTTMKHKVIGLDFEDLQKLSSGEILFRLKDAYSNISYALAKGLDPETIKQDIIKYGNYQHLTTF
jgi:hypothetical protein